MRATHARFVGHQQSGSARSRPAEAASRNRSAFCLRGTSIPGLSNCTFTSMAQCRASASGRRLRCIANPFYKGR